MIVSYKFRVRLTTNAKVHNYGEGGLRGDQDFRSESTSGPELGLEFCQRFFFILKTNKQKSTISVASGVAFCFCFCKLKTQHDYLHPVLELDAAACAS